MTGDSRWYANVHRAEAADARGHTNMSGNTSNAIGIQCITVTGLSLSLGGSDEALFDPYDDFVPESVPMPDAFLDGHDVLAGPDHVAFHRLTRDCFEERKVYDMTFDYNLARLNLDTRHPNAGYRYAEERSEAEDAIDHNEPDSVLRAEFTPTTPFCPQTHTLTIGSFRAWNGLADRHEYDLVRVRSAPMHHQSDAINDKLAEIESEYLESGDASTASADESDIGSNPMERAMQSDGPSRGPQAPPF